MNAVIFFLTHAAFNYEHSREVEEEYDRLRGLARQEAKKRGECFEKVRDKA